MNIGDPPHGCFIDIFIKLSRVAFTSPKPNHLPNQFCPDTKTLNSKHHESQSLRRIQESDIPSTSDMQSTFILRDLRSTFDILGGIILSRKNRMWKGSTKF